MITRKFIEINQINNILIQKPYENELLTSCCSPSSGFGRIAARTPCHCQLFGMLLQTTFTMYLMLWAPDCVGWVFAKNVSCGRWGIVSALHRSSNNRWTGLLISLDPFQTLIRICREPFRSAVFTTCTVVISWSARRSSTTLAACDCQRYQNRNSTAHLIAAVGFERGRLLTITSAHIGYR